MTRLDAEVIEIGMPKPSPSLRQVAAAAGVHHTTLSRALRGHPDISRERAEELRALAREMGYVPDPILRALAAYRTGQRPPAFHSVIAWLNPTEDHSHWNRHRTFRSYFYYAEERARELGFKLEVVSIPSEKGGESRLNAIFNARNINALIVAPGPHTDIRLDGIAWRNLAAVRLGYTLASPQLHSIAVNHYAGMRQIMRELFLRGYQRPGFCMGSHMDEKSDQHWSAAFIREQRNIALEDSIPLHLFDKFSYKDFSVWLDRYKPDVLIVVGDEVIPKSLKRYGLKVPEEIGLAALVQPEEADRISGISANHRGLGRAAVDFVVAMLNRQERGIPEHAQTLLIDNVWVERETLRPNRVE